MKKRFLSILLAVCMVLTLLPGLTLPAMAVNYGAFTVTYSGTAPVYSSGVMTLGSGTYTISGTTTADRIVVTSGATANITLSNVNIDVSTVNGCAFDMTGATVNLTLSGTNTLKSGTNGGYDIDKKGYAGLQVEGGSEVTISGTGSLEATGSEHAAGIGGSSGLISTHPHDGTNTNGANCGKITINSGTVKATGSYNAAGIGGGGGPKAYYRGGSGGEVTITGGTVIATGGDWRGAGIGGGGSTKGGAGGTITITGGNVTAIGGGNGAGIGGGGNDEGGTVGAAGIIKISNTAKVVAVSSGTKPSIEDDDGNITPDSGTAANVLVANYQSNITANTNTEVKDANSNSLSPAVSIAPIREHKSIAFTMPAGSYTLYTGAAKQMGTKSSTTSTTFAIVAGLNVFTDVTASTYIAKVTVNKDDSTWTVDTPTIKMSTSLSTLTGAVSGTLLNGEYTFNGLADGKTYYAWEDGATDTYTGQSVTIDSKSATVDYYTLSLANGTGTSTPTGSGIYLPGKNVSIDATVNTGYVWSKWTSSNTAKLTDQPTKSTSFAMPAAAITLTATAAPIQYDITYTLNGGTASGNPAKYTIESALITLLDPTRSGCAFLGWTGSNGTTAQKNITIPTGSTENKSYTANWKADKPASAPDASIITARTDTSISITTVAGYEYSVDNGANWYSGVSSYTFDGLTPGTAYNLICRKAAVSTGDISAASDASEALSVTTKAASSSVPVPAAPTVGTGANKPTSGSVTISTAAGNEYFISTSNSAPTPWPTSGVDYFKATGTDVHTFTGLTAGTQYYIWVRVAETNTAMPSNPSSISVYTAAATPGAGEGYTIDYSAETISITSGYEVSSDPSFDSDKLISSGAAITPGTTYYVRKAVNTTTTPNTPASEAVSFTAAAKPDAPSSSAYSFDYEDEQIIFDSQYEVFTATSSGGAVTSASTSITPGSTLYIRVKATLSAPASDWTTITIPARRATTGLSIAAVRTDRTITVDAISGAEYSKDGGASWQSSNEFTGLDPNTDYAINIRYAATDSSFASSPLGSVTLKTKTEAGTAPSALSVSTQTYNTITIEVNAGCQYAITTSSTAPTTWEAAETSGGTKVFSGLTAATPYYIWVRVAETDTAMPSNPGSISVYTAAATPGAGEGYTIDYSAETISITSGYEVSSDPSFASDNLLSDGAAITPGTTYYVRKAVNTTTTPNTPASEAVSFTAAAKPDAPSSSAYSFDYEDEQIIFDSQYEVFTTTSGGGAVTSASTSITPGSILYIRVKATLSAPASDWTTITIPARRATTGLSITAVRTDRTITVSAISGAEYSKDGGTNWQSSNEFTELDPNTNYLITIRYAATASSFASSPLDSVTIKTKAASASVPVPAAPSVSTRMYDSITIDTISGCQYAITTSNTAPTTWDAAVTVGGTKTFTGLTAATPYYIWVRVAETDTAMPSNPGSISVYTAAATPGAGEGYTIDFSAETIIIMSGYEVSASNGFGTTLPSGASVTPGTTYYVRKAVDTTTTPNTPASAAVSLPLPPRPELPAATGSAETVDNKNDGKISGVTAAMEWKAAGGTYAAVTTVQASNGITGLSDGTYYVRYMAVSGTGFKSAEQEITIAAGHTITVTFNTQGGSDVAGITGKAYGDSATAPADPTRSGFYFAGWYKEASCRNVWTFTLDTLTDNITLFAKWSAIPTYTVTGKIVDDASHPVEGATVRIMQGTRQCGATGVTDTNGDFSIDNVPPGTYNLVITKGIKTVVIKVTVSSGNVAIGNVALPAGNANSILVVNGSNTPSVVVGGLDSEAGAQLADSGDPDADIIEITLTVGQKDIDTATNGSEVAGTVTSAGKQVGMILDIDVSKTVNGTEDTSYNQTNGVIEIIIPLPAELQGKATYAVYRHHGASVDAITEIANTDGERIVIDRTNWTMTLYAKKFSTYAIGYTNFVFSGGGGGGSSTSYTITASAGEGGSISPNGEVSVTDGSRTFTITANEGYEIADVKVDGLSVGAVSSYTFTNVDADHTIEAAFERIENAALPYYIVNGREIFIGFASDASGTMTYIAPEGATVLFRENPKSFNDVAGHWAKDYIDFVTGRELFLGTGSGDFSPQSGMTRAMFATVIGRLYERSYGEILKKDDHAFTDVDYDAYYGAYIDWASENSIITGIGGGLFRPDQEITRQEMAAILYRFAKFLNVSPSEPENTQLSFPDAADIASWATEAAMYCQQTGIITGRSGGYFVPQGTATRAEVAAILQRFIENIV